MTELAVAGAYFNALSSVVRNVAKFAFIIAAEIITMCNCLA